MLGGLFGIANAAPINYMVIQYNGVTVNNGAKTLTVSASVQTSCPVGGIISYYGTLLGQETTSTWYSGYPTYCQPSQGAGTTCNPGTGTLTLSGALCVAGVPANVTLTPNGNLLSAPPIVLNSTYQSLQTQACVTCGGGRVNGTSVVLPDATAILIGVADGVGSGYGFTCARAFRTPVNGAGSIISNGLGIYCAGFMNVAGFVGQYLMGY